MQGRAIAVRSANRLSAGTAGRALDGARAPRALDSAAGSLDGGRVLGVRGAGPVRRALDALGGRVLDLGLAGVAAAQLAAAAWLVPTTSGGVATTDGTPLGALCWLHAAFGIDCPMCGMTRSFVALAHGDLGAAFRFHPAGPLLFVAMVALVVAVAVVAVRRTRPLVERRRFLFAFQTVAFVCIAMGVLKMVRS